MKKTVFLVFCILLSIFSPACTTPIAEYYGTWEITGVEIGEVLFTIEEAEAMGDYSFSGVKIIIKEGYKAILIDQYDTTIESWAPNGNGIRINQTVATLKDGVLSITKGENKLLFRKTSDSQTIPSDPLNYCGTWQAASMTNNKGETLTAKEFFDLGFVEIYTYKLVIKDTGKVYITAAGETQVTSWEVCDGGINIEGKVLPYKNDLLTLDLGDFEIHYERISD